MRLLPVLILAPTLAAAHPHEFVEAALTLRLDDRGHLVEIGVEWRYDPFTSMLILSDLGLDPTATDLAPQDAPALQGFDQDWIEGYNGDLWPRLDDRPLELSPLVPGPVEVRGGQVVSRHTRLLAQPADPRAGDLNIRVYDPEFYIAYTIAVPPVVEGGAGCQGRVYGPDMEAAREVLETALAELVDSTDLELAFPMVGEHFADELRVICD
jgi:polyphosphate kinase